MLQFRGSRTGQRRGNGGTGEHEERGWDRGFLEGKPGKKITFEIQIKKLSN